MGDSAVLPGKRARQSHGETRALRAWGGVCGGLSLGVLWAAGETALILLRHDYYFATPAAALAFVWIPIAVYGLGGALAGFLLAQLLGRRISEGGLRARRLLLILGLLNVAALVGIHALALQGQGREPLLPAGAAPGPSAVGRTPQHVILITIDTLRADHLGCYGHTASPTPFIDLLAARGVRFACARVPAVVTGPSHASILTSRYPGQHGLRENGWRLPLAELTLGEIFKAAGYRTAGAVSVYHMNAFISALSQGMDRFFDRSPLDRFLRHLAFRLLDKIRIALGCETRGFEERADETSARVFPWIRDHARDPFFLWLHYFDPHTPYVSPGDPARVYGDEQLDPLRFDEITAPDARAAMIRATIETYDEEIAFVDGEIGRLLDLLEELQISEETLIVFTADHGEHMAEARVAPAWWFTHADVYEEAARVPLIISWPQGAWAGEVSQPVSTLDIAPTLVELLGRSADAYPFEGRSLVPLLDSCARFPTMIEFPPRTKERTGKVPASNPAAGISSAWAERSFLIECNPHTHLGSAALVCGSWKLILRPQDPPELYDLAGDPGEQRNRAEAEPERVREMGIELQALFERYGAGAGAVEQEIDERTRESLRTLGYID